MRDIKLTVQHRRLDEFHGGYGRLMPVRIDGDSTRSTLATVKLHLLQGAVMVLGAALLYFGIVTSSLVGFAFAIGLAIWSYWMATQVAHEVHTRLPREPSNKENL